MFCRKCGTQLNADARFCKKCGAASAPYETRVQSDQINQAYQPSVVYDQASVALNPQLDNKRARWIGLAIVAALIVAVYFWYSRVSIERKLEAAMTQGNLLRPPGQSAIDYYQKLKQGGMSERRKQIEAKLLPAVTARPLQMIAEIASPVIKPETTLNDWQEAQTLMEWAREMRPDDNVIGSRADYCAGRVADLSNRKDEAITYWKRAAERDATWALPLNGIGLVHNGRKNYQTARSFFFEAVRREPQFAMPYNNIGTSFLLEKNDTQAEDYYRQAIERAPQWPRPHAWLGEIAMRRKDFNTAAQEFETTINLDPAGASGIDMNRIRQQLDQARQMGQQAAYFVDGEIWLSLDNPEARVWLHPDRWSEKVIPAANYGFSFDGPADAMVQFADGTEGSIHRNYGSNNEWLKGFRFRGTEGGQVTVRITRQR